MRKLLLSRSNFSYECQEFWKARRWRLPVTLVSANRVRKSIDLWKLSLMSSHVMNLKNSFEIPDSLSYLLDIDIILPDFSEDVVRILCDVLEGGNTDVFTNIASFNELNELIGVLNITLGPSLMKIDYNNEEYCEEKFGGFMKEEFLKAEDAFIKEEPLNVKEELNGYTEKMPLKLTKGDENANILNIPLTNASINTPLIKDLSSSVGASAKSTSPNEASGSTSKKNEESGSGKLFEDALRRMTEMEEDAIRLRTENEELAKQSTEKEEIAKAELNNARARNTKCEEEKKQMKKELEEISSKHCELIREVEIQSAITESHRMLIEEKEKLHTTVEEFKTAAAMAESSLVPLESRLKEVEERANNLAMEKMALQTEAEIVTKRSDQLVEKELKMNIKLEELKKLQETKVQLTNTLNNVGAEKKQLEEKLSSLTNELESIKQQLTLSQQEGKKNTTDLQDKAKELQRVTQQSVGLKNIQANLQRQVNELKKKTEDLEKKKQDANILLTQDSPAGNENMQNIQKLGEVQKLIVLKDAEIETHKKDIASKESVINKNKNTVMQLKKIGRNFREKAEASEKILTELTLEKKKVDEKLAKAIEKGEAAGSTSKKDRESGKLLELEDALCRLTEMEEDANKLRAENKELAKKITEKEERAKAVLINARARITKCEEEKKQLEKELEEIASKRDSAVSSEAHLQTKVSNLISQYNTLSTDKERLDGEKAEALQEKERLIEKVEQLQQELVASKMCSPAGLSPSAPTMASVPPTLKRPREAPDFDSQSGTDERTGYSGYQKKAKGKAAF